jgi:hypothetical protein
MLNNVSVAAEMKSLRDDHSVAVVLFEVDVRVGMGDAFPPSVFKRAGLRNTLLRFGVQPHPVRE